MATISTAISLQDKISRTLDHITTKANTVSKAMEEINKDTQRLSNAGMRELINPSALGVIYKARDGIKQFDDAFNKVKTSVKGFSVNKTLNGAKTAAVALGNAFKNVVNTKWNVLKIGIGNVKNVLTEGQTGAKGFLNSLKNIGKISISGVANGIKKAASGLKGLGAVTLNTVINGLKKMGGLLKKVSGLAAKGASTLAKWTFKGAAIGLTAGTAAVTALGTAAVKTGMDFEKGMSQVAATMLIDKNDTQNGGAEKYKILEDAARECGRSTAFSATEAAEGLNYLALAGYEAEKAAAALPTVLQLAGAGAMELGAASDMVTDSMAALNIQATPDNLVKFADQLAIMASKSNTSVAQLGEAIKTVGGTASGLAGGTAELDASLGILADVGIKGAEGGTHLRNMILALQNPINDAAAALFDEMGISAYDNVTGNMRSMGDIFGDLNKQLEGANAEKVNSTLSTIFNKTDLAAARAMMAATTDSVKSLGSVMDAELSASGKSLASLGINLEEMAAGFDKATTQEQFAAQMLEQFGLTADQSAVLFDGMQSIVGEAGTKFEELSKYAREVDGACADMYAIQLDNLTGDISILKSGLSDLGISLYEDMQQPLRGAAQYASSLVGILSQNYASGGIEGMVGGLGDILSNVIGKAITYLPNIVNLGTTLITNLLDGISSNMGIIETAIPQIISVIVSGLTTIIPSFIETGKSIILGLISGISSSAGAISTGISQIAGVFLSAFLEIVISLGNAVGNMLPTIVPIIIQGILNLINIAVTNVPGIIEAGINIIMGLANGLLNAIPLLIAQAPIIVQNLINGIITALPMINKAALQLIIMLIKGIIQNLPAINQSAFKIVTSLICGIIDYLPVFIDTIPEIFGMIKEAILSVNWLECGLNILLAIGEGVFTGVKEIGSSISNAVKGIFGGNKEEVVSEGKDIGLSYSTGVIGGLNPISLSSAADEAVNSLNTDGTSAGFNLGNTYKLGFQDGLSGVAEAAANVETEITGSFSSIDLTNNGLETMTTFNTGMNNGIADITATASTIGENITADFEAVDVTSQGSNIVGTLSDGMSNEAGTAVNTAENISSNITNTFSKIDLTSIGSNIMKGLNNGMLQMKSTLLATAESIANGISSKINSALDIHSPSKKTMYSGKMVGLGLIEGIDSTLNAIEKKSDEAAFDSIIGFDDKQKEYLLRAGSKGNSGSARQTVIKINMSGMKNTINKEMDFDKFIELLEDKLESSLRSTAEGVY